MTVPYTIPYENTFKDIKFTTHHNLAEYMTGPIIRALEAEAGENLREDHWHPEIAGPLQMAIHFLQSRRREAA